MAGSEYIFSSNRVTLYRSDFMSERFVNSSITMIMTSNLFVVHKTDQLVIRAQFHVAEKYGAWNVFTFVIVDKHAAV